MQRIPCDERADWRAKAEEAGFNFHTMDGERYWDERAYYAFTLKEIEDDIEAPTAELDAMCRDLVARAVDDETMLRRLKIPERFWTYIAASWKRGDPSLYGRFDLSYSGQGPAKLLEYNADTPTSVFETAVFQWMWLEDARARHMVPADADQYNSLHERLIEGWNEIGAAMKDAGGHLHLAGSLDQPEDDGTLAYLEDTARQAGFTTTRLAMDQIGRRPNGTFVDAADQPVALMFKLYPWEWMFREQFGASLAGSPTRWIEPPWKAILSNKGILPLLWEANPRHPNLLPAYFEDDPRFAELGGSFVRKPLYSREGANISLVFSGETLDQDGGPYGAEGFVRQALAPLPRFGEDYAAVGSWVAAGKPCGLSMREDLSPITKNSSRFLPHAIVG
jgi:glutathionylspermidine synthase